MPKSWWLPALLVGIGSVAAGGAFAQTPMTSTLYPSGIEAFAGVDGVYMSGPKINGFTTVVSGDSAVVRQFDPTPSPQGWTPVGEAGFSFPIYLGSVSGARLNFSVSGGTVSSNVATSQILANGEYHNILFIDGSPTHGLEGETGNGNLNTLAANGSYSYALSSLALQIPAPGPIWGGFGSVELGIAGMWNNTSWNAVAAGQLGFNSMTLNESVTGWAGGPMIGLKYTKPLSDKMRFVANLNTYVLLASADLNAHQATVQNITSAPSITNITVTANSTIPIPYIEPLIGVDYDLGFGRVGLFGIGSFESVPAIVNPRAASSAFSDNRRVSIGSEQSWSAGVQLRFTVPFN